MADIDPAVREAIIGIFEILKQIAARLEKLEEYLEKHHD